MSLFFRPVKLDKSFITLIVASLGTILVSISAHASGMAFDGAGNLFVGTGNGSIFKLTPDGKRSTFASGLQPEHLAFDRSGNLFVSGRNNQSILKLTPDGKKSTFAMGIKDPVDLTFDDKSNLFVLDKGSSSILKFTPDGKQSTFASGLTDSVDLAIDRGGNLFVSASNGTIFKFTPDGTKTTFSSKIGWPNAMAIDGAGNLFVGDMDNHLILKFTPNGEKIPSSPRSMLRTWRVTLWATFLHQKARATGSSNMLPMGLRAPFLKAQPHQTNSGNIGGPLVRARAF